MSANTTESTPSAAATLAVLIYGIRIQKFQAITRDIVKAYEKKPLAATQNEIDNRRLTIRALIADWRAKQTSLMPALGLAQIDRVACDVEKEILGLPSDLGLVASANIDADVLRCAIQEADLREGMANDALAGLKHAARMCGVVARRVKQGLIGQNQCVRGQKEMTAARGTRDDYLKDYQAARGALSTLDSFTTALSYLPDLTRDDVLGTNPHIFYI
ncbi:hypothetical protein C8R47DRAFT_1207044 [Mycena vitilis]|nr:hypothetical protein C8R47DRAFT_1216149 [Mycena vitilis]KAJ6513746.1 hypothetical protein C8R47DRAFT_1207044 [Mycena vitilis]